MIVAPSFSVHSTRLSVAIENAPETTSPTEPAKVVRPLKRLEID